MPPKVPFTFSANLENSTEKRRQSKRKYWDEWDDGTGRANFDD